MNLARFQISLNHNDPDVVAKGLEEFQSQALWDLTCSADSSCRYGYYGRSCINEWRKTTPDSIIQRILHPTISEDSDLDGILFKYIAASPEIEELFVIWALPNRDFHLTLSVKHTLGTKIANRIISDHSKAIVNQLSSRSAELVHCTIGLLFSMCKISANICQAVFIKIISTSLQTFTTVMQNKQTVSFSCINEHDYGTANVEIQQLMTTLLVLTVESCVIEHTDESIAILDQILPAPNHQSHQTAAFGSSTKSLLKKLMQHTVHKESSSQQRFLMLHGLLYLLQYPALDPYLHILLDSAFIQKLLSMNSNSLIDDQNNLVQQFFLTLSHELVKKCASFKKGGQYSASFNSVHSCAATIIRHLKAEVIVEHKQIQEVLVEGISSLLSKCVSALTISSWQPASTPQYFSCLSHLSWLVSRAGVDTKTKAALKKMVAAGSSIRKSPADELLRVVIPSELTKKDMIKLLSHSDSDLKWLGWVYVSNVLAWLLRVFTEASVARSGHTESVLIEHGFFRVLPDVAFILSIRSGVLRDVNAISKVKEKAVEPASAPDTVLVQVEVDNMVEDFDFNFDGATDSNDAVHNAEAAVSAPVLPCHEMSESPERHERLTVDAKILRMVHKVIEYYMLLIPNSVLQEKFDLLKLLDEHVKWSPQQTLNEAVDNWNVTADSTLTLSILHILKLCSKGHCRWFGTLEETTKSLTNILVAEDWKKSTKRTVLAKLMILTHCGISVHGTPPAMVEDVASKARSLLKAIIVDSQLFFGQVVLDLELGIELNSWLRTATVGSDWEKYSMTTSLTNESVLIVDILLHLAYHWNTGLCIEISSIASVRAQDIKYMWSVWDKRDFSIMFPSIEPKSVEDMLPVSPLLFAAMCLSKLDLKVFAAQLPVYVQNYVADRQAPSSQIFFQKYLNGFSKDLEGVVLDILYTTWKSTRSRGKYLDVIERLLLGHGDFESTSSLHTIEHIQKWKQLICGEEPIDISFTSLPYQQIFQLDRIFNCDNKFPVLRRLLKKKSRKQNSDSERLHTSSAILFSVYVLSSLGSQTASTESILRDFMSSNVDIISVVYLRQSEQNIISHNLEWLCDQVRRMGEEANSSVLRQAVFLSYALQLSNSCCQSFGCTISTHAQNETDDIFSESKAFAVGMKSFVDTLFEAIDKLLNSQLLRSSALFITVLSSSSSHVLEEFVGSSCFSGFSRQLLFRHAQSQLSFSHAKSKLKDPHELSAIFLVALVTRFFSHGHECNHDDDVITFGGKSPVTIDSLMLLINKLVHNEYLQAYCAKLILRYPSSGFNVESVKLLKRAVSRNRDASVSLYEVDPTCQLIVNQFEVKFFQKIVFDKEAKFFDIIPSGGEGQVAAPRPGSLLTITNESISYYLNPFSLIDMNAELKERNDSTALEIDWSSIQSSIFSSPYLLVLENCLKKERAHNTGVMETIMILASTPVPMLNTVTKKLSSYELASYFSDDWSHGFTTASPSQYCDVVSFLVSINDGIIVKASRALLYILQRHGETKEAVNFVHNFLSVAIQCPTLSSTAMAEYSTMLTLPVIILMQNTSPDEDGPSIVLEILLDILVYYLDSLVAVLKQNILLESGAHDQYLYERLLDRVCEFLALEYSRFTDDCAVKLDAVRRKLNSAIKYGLKVYFDSSLTHSFVFDIFVLATRKEHSLIYGLLQSTQGLHKDSLLRPVAILQMITGHSKFVDIMSTKKVAHDAKNGVLKLALIFISSIVEKSVEEGSDSFESSCAILLDVFQQEYTGTLSVSDRLMLRIIQLLYSKRIGEAPCTHVAKNATSTRPKANTADSKMEWMIDSLSLSMVYSTLADYSIQRPAYSVPFGFESPAVHNQHSFNINKQLQLLTTVMTQSVGKKRRSSGEEYDDEYKDTLHSDKYPAPLKVDTMDTCADKSYDPSFILTALLYMFQRGTVNSSTTSEGDKTLSDDDAESVISMRKMASTGGLALIIAGLSSSCPVNRTYALACLHKVWVILKSQTAEKDALFKERPQLQLLLNFIRNATADLHQKSVFRLPPGTAIFLARCSIQLMQPAGELYSEMNRYLLSRPFCDECDVPLLDFIIFNGDVETFIIEKVAALRLVRDGLLTAQDHLNLSRKNAYNRLMIMFPIICNDTRAGHAILDIFDRALRIKISAQYLLEQCDFLHFIGVLLSPASRAVDQEGNSDLSALFGPTSKYLLRLFQLFRRVVTVTAHLARRGEMSITTVLHAQSFLLDYHSKLKVLKDNQEAHILKQLPEEYFRSMSLCMWDIALSLTGLSEHHNNLRLADVDVVSSFVSIVEAYEAAKMSTNDAVKISDIVVTVVCLLAFKSSYSNGAMLPAAASKCDIKLVVDKCRGICMQKLLKRDSPTLNGGTFYAVEHVRVTAPAVLPHRNSVGFNLASTAMLDLDALQNEVEILQIMEEEFLVYCCLKIMAQGSACFERTDEFDFLSFARLGLVIWSTYFHDAGSVLCHSVRPTARSVIVAIEGVCCTDKLRLHYSTNVLSLVRLAFLLAHNISMQSDRIQSLKWTIAADMLSTMAQLQTIVCGQSTGNLIIKTVDELCQKSNSSLSVWGIAMTKTIQLSAIIVTALDAVANHPMVETSAMEERVRSITRGLSALLKSLEADAVDISPPNVSIWDVAVDENSFLHATRIQNVENSVNRHQSCEDTRQGREGLLSDHNSSKHSSMKRPCVRSGNSSRIEKKRTMFRPFHLNHHL